MVLGAVISGKLIERSDFMRFIIDILRPCDRLYRHRRSVLNRLPIALIFILPITIGLLTSAARAQTSHVFNGLQQRLSADGFNAVKLKKIFGRPEVFFDTHSVALFFMHNEARLNYGQFTTAARIAAARQYMLLHGKQLDAAEKAHGVPKEIITAIILVETKLGIYLGGSQIINTLSTMASLSDPRLREKLWQSIPSSRRLSRQAFLKKVKQKSQWAYTELKALFVHANQQGIDPVSIRGSYAGAMGIPQFMPSNILSLAEDGDNDGRIDLFDHADAIMSIASYLAHYGWRPGISRDKAYRVLLHYNYSRYYANTILKIADLLRAKG